MDISMINQVENKMYDRTEISFSVTYPAGENAPKKNAVRDALAETVGKKKDLVVLVTLHPAFGTTVMKGTCNVYKNPERIQEVERDYILKRNNLFKGSKKKKEKSESEGGE